MSKYTVRKLKLEEDHYGIRGGNWAGKWAVITPEGEIENDVSQYDGTRLYSVYDRKWIAQMEADKLNGIRMPVMPPVKY